MERVARLAQRQRRAGICDRRLDLAAVAHDRVVEEQALDVVFRELRDHLGIEARERAPEGLALAQDRQPRQAGLEALEAEPLVDAALVAHRPAPLVVVVGGVERVAPAEAANVAQLRPNGRSRVTTPSSTVTGYVPTGAVAGSVRARPVRRSKVAP